MYSDEDLDAAVRNGDITAEGAAALRRSAAARIAARRPDAAAEGERLRLVSGFHDVSVAGAALLTLACMIPFTVSYGATATSLAAAAVAWGLAEHFTRVRRLALTSIVLMLVFVAAAGGAAFGFTGARAIHAARLLGPGRGGFDPAALADWGVIPLAAAAAASALHWMRFRVPAGMGAVAATVAALALAVLLLNAPAASAYIKPLTFAAGLAVFAFAMRWDLSDPARRTSRSDVAFWLHLAAAPMLVGPAFAAVGAVGGSGPSALSTGSSIAAIGLYVAISAAAVAIDRRALMASALFYLLVAVASLLASKGTSITTLALTGLVVGPALLLLSALWGRARRATLAALPGWLARRLPPLPATA